VCGGAELSWLAVSDNPFQAADSHAIASLLRMRDAALSTGAGSTRCQDGWALRCFDAARRHAELAAVLYGLPPQPALGAWTTAAGLRLANPSPASHP
jgi:hypothetical protein